MAVVIARSRPFAQVFRLLGTLVAMLLLMTLGLGIARWRSSKPGESPYGALSTVASVPAAGSGASPAQTVAPVPPPGGALSTPPSAAADPASPAAPARLQPRIISLGKGGVDPSPPRPAPAAAVPAPAPQAPAAAPIAKPAVAEPAVIAAVDKGDAPPGLGININTASVEDLNRIPGAGRIGRTIVRHRPYSSVQDLLDHRVLRASEYARIKSLLKAN